MNTKTKVLALTGANLVASFAIAGPASAAVTTESHATKMEAANAASLPTVESAWLKVTMMCKDRSFSSDPIHVKPKPLPRPIVHIHQQLGVGM